MKKMKKNLIFAACLVFLAIGFVPSFANGEDCGTLATGHKDRINGVEYCIVDNTMRGCAVIIDPCPIQ